MTFSRLGFTGTRKGLSIKQEVALNKTLKRLFEMVKEVHHGDCVGADSSFHHLCFSKGYKIIIHPPTHDKYRAFLKGAEFRRPRPYLERNKKIVDETDFIIACPDGYKEILRSGTWSTIRYAKRMNKTVIVIYPDGSDEMYHRKEVLVID